MSNPSLVISGTDTGIGKTVFSAALTHALQAHYWKPVQSGLEEETDSDTVKRLASTKRIIPERWRLQLPASPHLSASVEGIEITPDDLTIPITQGALIIEGAGGLMVPLNRKLTFIDLFSQWQRPVILCARTELGTINHTLLSLEALHSRSIPVLGVAFIGNPNEDSEQIICELGHASRLGRLPVLETLTTATLANAFAENFNLNDFTRLAF